LNHVGEKMTTKIVALPCIAFSVKEREIIRKYGFLTYPEFLDNFYVRHKTRGYSLFLKLLKKYNDQVKFAVAPDYNYKLAERLKEKYEHINWIFPLHKKSELEVASELNFEWLGMPHRRKFRNYSIQWFVKHSNFKLWYFWNERKPWILQYFDGFDTTIPETYSGKYGKIWLTWGKAEKANNMRTIEIFEANVRNLKNTLKEYGWHSATPKHHTLANTKNHRR